MTIQNGYNLVNRIFDLANSEISISQMELFLKNNKSLLEKLAYEHNKKIKSFTS